MVGLYNDPWKIWKEKKGKEYVTWREVIQQMLQFPFQKQRELQVVKLKTAYGEKCKT